MKNPVDLCVRWAFEIILHDLEKKVPLNLKSCRAGVKPPFSALRHQNSMDQSSLMEREGVRNWETSKSENKIFSHLVWWHEQPQNLKRFLTFGLVAGGERWGPLSSLLRHLLRVRSTPQATRKKPHLWGESFFQWSIHLVWFGSGNLFLSQSLTCTREDVAEDFLVYAKEQTIRQYKWQHFLKPIDDNRCKRCKMWKVKILSNSFESLGEVGQ